jgi:hypothetical protein
MQPTMHVECITKEQCKNYQQLLDNNTHHMNSSGMTTTAFITIQTDSDTGWWHERA